MLQCRVLNQQPAAFIFPQVRISLVMCVCFDFCFVSALSFIFIVPQLCPDYFHDWFFLIYYCIQILECQVVLVNTLYQVFFFYVTH